MRFCETPYDPTDLSTLVCHPFRDTWEIPEFDGYSPQFTRRDAFSLVMQDHGFDDGYYKATRISSNIGF